MKVDRELLTVNHTLNEKLKDLEDFNTMLLRTLNELLIENDNLRTQNEDLTHRLEVCMKELKDRKETFKVLTNRHREEIHSLTVDNRILRRQLEELERES